MKWACDAHAQQSAAQQGDRSDSFRVVTPRQRIGTAQEQQCQEGDMPRCLRAHAVKAMQ